MEEGRGLNRLGLRCLLQGRRENLLHSCLCIAHLHESRNRIRYDRCWLIGRNAYSTPLPYHHVEAAHAAAQSRITHQAPEKIFHAAIATKIA